MRRLLSFLLRKMEQKENIHIDIFKLSNAIYNKPQRKFNSNNILTFPEARFVPLVATFQKSANSWQEDQSFLQKQFQPKISKLNIFQCATEILSSTKTSGGGFTHTLRVYLILKNLNFMTNVIPARDFIPNKFKKPFLFDDGSKLYFKLDTG